MNGLSENYGNFNDKSDNGSETGGSKEAGTSWLYQVIEIFNLNYGIVSQN
jgi:hypothetical protein